MAVARSRGGLRGEVGLEASSLVRREGERGEERVDVNQST